MMKKKWIGKAVRNPGALSRQLGIPVEKDIPMRLLDRIVSAKAGQTVMNPTGTGRGTIKVTRLLERRAILARNLKSLRKKA
jgi:hypothetical protein